MIERGGEGSGNKNHAGRPGQIGGSAPSEDGGNSNSDSSGARPNYDNMTHWISFLGEKTKKTGAYKTDLATIYASTPYGVREKGDMEFTIYPTKQFESGNYTPHFTADEIGSIIQSIASDNGLSFVDVTDIKNGYGNQTSFTLNIGDPETPYIDHLSDEQKDNYLSKLPLKEGITTFYHGTSSDVLNSVLEKGLTSDNPGATEIVVAGDKGWSKAEMQYEGRNISVFMTTSKYAADFYAHLVSDNRKSDCLVLEISVPSNLVIPDELTTGGGAFRFPGNIPPDWITSYTVYDSKSTIGSNPKTVKTRTKSKLFYALLLGRGRSARNISRTHPLVQIRLVSKKKDTPSKKNTRPSQ